MRIIAYTSLLPILLVVLQVNSLCTKELEEQCGTYCYQVVQPLLQYANSLKSMAQKFTELEEKIKEQTATITILNESIKHKDLLFAQQIELSASYKSNIENHQRITIQNEYQMANLHSEVKSKDIIINDLQSQLKENEQLTGKIKQLEDKITAVKQTSSCLGKLTELHAINVPKEQTFTVACDSDLAGEGWTVIQRRKDGSVNFNRTWSEYKEGFGDLRGEFFIGLEKLHLITHSQPHELYVSLKDFANESRFARYSNFAVGSEAEAYELKTLGSYSGSAGDSLRLHKNMKFSTPDRSNNNGTCAKSFSSGWWFRKCYYCNLNGIYVHEDLNTEINSIEWRDWKYRPMKFSQMMIKPKSD